MEELMSTPAVHYDIEPHRWGTIFASLSLDLVAPYVSQMGLQLPPGTAFLEGLRNIIERYRSLETKDAGAERDFAPAVFQWASETFGRAFTDHLYAWGQDVFQTGPDSGVNAFLWNNIVRRGGLDGRRDSQVPPELISRVRKKLAAREKSAVNRLSPASEWDKTVYERQQYDRFRNPMELVQATITHYDFVSAWTEASLTMPIPMDDEVKKWGRQEASLLGMPSSRLGEPGAWRPAPSGWR
jgi:hypothetical protein